MEHVWGSFWGADVQPVDGLGFFVHSAMLTKAEVLHPPFTSFEKGMLQFLHVAPSQISSANWGSMRVVDLVMSNFRRSASVDLFLYLFNVVWNSSRDSRKVPASYH